MDKNPNKNSYTPATFGPGENKFFEFMGFFEESIAFVINEKFTEVLVEFFNPLLESGKKAIGELLNNNAIQYIIIPCDLSMDFDVQALPQIEAFIKTDIMQEWRAFAIQSISKFNISRKGYVTVHIKYAKMPDNTTGFIFYIEPSTE